MSAESVKWSERTLRRLKQELGVLTMADLLRGPQQGSGKETSKSLRGSIDRGVISSLSLPLPWEA